MAVYSICSLEEIQAKGRLEADLDGIKVVIFLHDNVLHCVQALCPHRGAPLKDAHLCEDLVVCSWHRSVFDLSSGRYLEGPCNPELSLKKYETQINQGRVEVIA